MLDKKIKIEYESKVKNEKPERNLETVNEAKDVNDMVTTPNCQKVWNEQADDYIRMREEREREEEIQRKRDEEARIHREQMELERQQAIEDQLAYEEAIRQQQIDDDIEDLLIAAYLLDS